MDISRARSRRLLSLVVLALLLVGLTATLAMPVSAAPVDDVADTAQEGAGTDEGAPGSTIEILPLRGGFIDPPVSAQVAEVLDLAAAEGSELVVLQYSSGGGVSVDLDDLLARIEASPVPVAVLIGPVGSQARAAGAAGLLWAAADIRAIAPDAAIGPLDPVDLADLDGAYPTRERTAAFVEAGGGDLEVLDRLLAEEVDAETLVDAGVADLTATGLEPLLLELDGVTVASAAGEQELRIRADEVEVRFHSLGLVRRLLHAATTAPFIYLLLTVGLGMLLFEVFQPGFGVAGFAGIITAAVGAFGLTVLPVTWWAVALVVLGLVLYAVDTAIAGFGWVTAAATAAFVVGSRNFYAADALALPVWLVMLTTATALVFFVGVMTSILRAQAGPEGVVVDDLVGKPGIVRSVLNPEGHVYIDGALWRARWTGDARRAKVGTPVRVHGVDGPVVLVEPFDPSSATASASSAGAGGDAASDVPTS